MDEQTRTLPDSSKKKVITLFGKKINVQSQSLSLSPSPSPSSPLINHPFTPPQSIASPPITTHQPNNNDTTEAIEPPFSSSSSPDPVRVLKLRVHLLEQKVKQLGESNENLSTQLTSQIRRCDDLEIQREELLVHLMKQREKVQACEKENDVLQYKLELVEKMYADKHHTHSPYSPPPLLPLPLLPPIPPHAWMDDMYGAPEGERSDRRRDYVDHHPGRHDRYEDRVELEYDDERGRGRRRGGERARNRDRNRGGDTDRDRDRDGDRDRDRDRDRDGARDRERDRDIDRDPQLYDYRPYSNDLQLPSPPPSSPSHTITVFNRLGASSSDLPNLPSPPFSPLEDKGNDNPSKMDRDRDRDREREREERERERVSALEARLDLPLDTLAKISKSEKKANNNNSNTNNNNNNNNKKRPLCKYYMEGTCKNKGACKFSHQAPSSSNGNKHAKLDL